MKFKQPPPQIRAKLWRFSRALSIAMMVHCLLWSLRGPLVRSDLGRDELCNAASHGWLGEMQFLLESGANPSVVGWDGHYTPLGEAVRGGQVESARLLLKWGADPNVPGDWDHSAINAAEHGWGADKPEQDKVIALLRSVGGKD